jgi:polyisoprenoid-binding protein YceI
VLSEARATLHVVRAHTFGLRGFIEASLAQGNATLGLPSRIELDSSRLKSGNRLLDRELQNRLEVPKHPLIIGEAQEITSLASGRFRVRGQLTLHGLSRGIECLVSLRPLSSGELEITGEQTIDMRDFGLPPPSLLILRVEPLVRIRARLIATPPK